MTNWIRKSRLMLVFWCKGTYCLFGIGICCLMLSGSCDRKQASNRESAGEWSSYVYSINLTLYPGESISEEYQAAAGLVFLVEPNGTIVRALSNDKIGITYEKGTMDAVTLEEIAEISAELVNSYRDEDNILILHASSERLCISDHSRLIKIHQSLPWDPQSQLARLRATVMNAELTNTMTFENVPESGIWRGVPFWEPCKELMIGDLP